MQNESTFKTWINRLTGKDKAFNLAHAGKWTLYFVAIGLIAGLGSIVFHYLCQLGLHFFMDMAAGYRPPSPAGEHHLLTPTARPFNRWILLWSPTTPKPIRRSSRLPPGIPQ